MLASKSVVRQDLHSAVPNLDAMSKQEIENLIHERFGGRAGELIALLEEHAKDCQRAR
jgi:hypothetical protein